MFLTVSSINTQSLSQRFWITLYRMDNFISFLGLGPSQWLFHFGEEIVTAWTHIGWVRWMFQNLSLPAVHEVHDSSSSSVTHCIVMKNDGVLYHQVWFFSRDCWKNVVLQEHAVVGSVYCLSWSYSVMQYYPINVIHHNEHHLHSTLCRAHFFRRGEPGWFHSLYWCFKFRSYERTQISSIATISSRSYHLPTRPVQLRNGDIVVHLKFHGVSNAQQICSNPECHAEGWAQFCDILRLPLLNHVQSISDQHPTGNKELNCVVLHVE